jgi:hypothetical protein
VGKLLRQPAATLFVGAQIAIPGRIATLQLAPPQSYRAPLQFLQARPIPFGIDRQEWILSVIVLGGSSDSLIRFSLAAGQSAPSAKKAPLPVIGAAAAFGFSRKLRQRITTAQADSSRIGCS